MKQRWQMRIATLAVGALLGVVGTGYAKSLPTYDTTKATAEAQTLKLAGFTVNPIYRRRINRMLPR